MLGSVLILLRVQMKIIFSQIINDITMSFSSQRHSSYYKNSHVINNLPGIRIPKGQGIIFKLKGNFKIYSMFSHQNTTKTQKRI